MLDLFSFFYFPFMKLTDGFCSLDQTLVVNGSPYRNNHNVEGGYQLNGKTWQVLKNIAGWADKTGRQKKYTNKTEDRYNLSSRKRNDWLISMVCQFVCGYFMPRGQGITFIVPLYLHFLCSCFLRVFCFFNSPIKYK